MRTILALFVAVTLSGLPSISDAENTTRWSQFKARFIDPGGRVIDTQNNEMSHSEGQAYALLLAVHFNDPATFARVRSWTQRHLALRDDGLLMWSWDAESQSVSDRNAASDAELIYAWAHWLGARRFQNPAYRGFAVRHFARIREALIVRRGGGTYLLPGPTGFTRDDRLTLNPSYWVFGAIDAAARADSMPGIWEALATTGEKLLADARFGAGQLPADWVTTKGDGVYRPARDFDPHYGFEAIRIPLYLIGSGRSDHAAIASIAMHHRQHPGVIVWNVESDTAVLSGAHAGVASIAALAICAVDNQRPSRTLDLSSDYYPASLQLLVERAIQHSGDKPCDQ